MARSTFTLRKLAAAGGILILGAAIPTACSVEDTIRPRIDVGAGTGSIRPAVPPNAGLYGFPMPAEPEYGVVPETELACRRSLDALGVTFRDLPAVQDGGGCGIDYPVEVTGLPGGVELKPAATLNCEMAKTFARWTKEELTPAARLRYFSGIQTIHQGSSYSCRTIGNRRGGTLSEHAKGNALDIMYITLKNGRDIDVRRPGLFAFRQRSLLNSVRGDACDYFTTVLGPGYNRDHKDHFHFDLKQRRNGYRACR